MSIKISRLPDPSNDRVVKDLPRPPNKPLDNPQIFDKKGKPLYDTIASVLFQQGFLSKPQLKQIIQMATDIFRQEPNLIQLEDPINIVGDLHGQYYDLFRLIKKAGDPLKHKYLFLGDYVNRGIFSIEVIIYIYSMKICFKKSVFLLRGNHETRAMTKFMNFFTECGWKYDQEIYEMIIDSFNYLPLACVLNGKVLCLHGGISPQLKTL